MKYFYVKIPNQPNVKLKYDPKAPARERPVHVDRNLDGAGRLHDGDRRLQGARQDDAKRQGPFVQMPVASRS